MPQDFTYFWLEKNKGNFDIEQVTCFELIYQRHIWTETQNNNRLMFLEKKSPIHLHYCCLTTIMK